jgi:DASS family divalent anion:Na+ symporter
MSVPAPGVRPDEPAAAGPAPRARIILLKAAPFALGAAIWFAPVPAGLTPGAWHLFALFAAAIAAVILGAFPLLTSALVAAAAAVLSGTLPPARAFAGFSNGSVLLVVTAFLVARSVVKSGLGRRISLLVVSLFGRSTLGLAYSIFVTDALIAPAFPSNTARGGVLYPIVLSLAEGAGSSPSDPARRRTGGFLMFSGMASLAVSSALWLTATSANPIGASVAEHLGVRIGFGSWLVASCVPALAAIALLPLFLYWLHPPETKATPDAPAAAKRELAAMGRFSRSERIVAVAFVLMVAGWVLGPRLGLDGTAIAFLGLGGLLATRVLTVDDLSAEGGTLVTFLWLAVLFAMSAQLNELGFMGYVGERLAHRLAGLSWPAAFVALAVLYVAMHYFFVAQSAQVLALFGVFADVGIRSGVPAPLMAYTLLFASSYFSTITPQGGTQNVIFVGSGYLTQRELYRLGGLTTAFCLVIFLVVGTPWLLLVAR